VSAYAVATHCRFVAAKCRSRPIVGSDTLTMGQINDCHEVRDRQHRERAPAVEIWECGRHWSSKVGEGTGTGDRKEVGRCRRLLPPLVPMSHTVKPLPAARLIGPVEILEADVGRQPVEPDPCGG